MTFTKRDLATWMRCAIDTHEASWVDAEPRGRYTKRWEECVDACPDPKLRELVVAMLQSGFCDFPYWADEVLAQETVDNPTR
jgi:hypothetical protein